MCKHVDNLPLAKQRSNHDMHGLPRACVKSARLTHTPEPNIYSHGYAWYSTAHRVKSFQFGVAKAPNKQVRRARQAAR